ncbi:MAG: WecB/TagA/CpsF family glycosyltransferase [Spirochaetaceae bacterium]|nr:WecB/TagA/CpsF family glycosyltransferase [Spirochaetaceae bacterium]
METIKIAGKNIGELRLDFPTDRQLAALISAWFDGRNHQVCFIDERRLGKAKRVSEYASMIASADLVLPETASLARKACSADSCIHEISVPQSQEEYLSCFSAESAGDAEKPEWRQYNPLRTLNILLSALEQRNGTIFLIGGVLPMLQKAERNLKSTFPLLRLVGRYEGNYLPKEEAAIMTALQKASPDLILVGSFVDGDELWIPRHMSFTRSGIFFSSDSIIEILAGQQK